MEKKHGGSALSAGTNGKLSLPAGQKDMVVPSVPSEKNDNLILKSLKLIFCVRYCPCDERKNKYFAFERCFPIQKYWGMAQAGRSDLQTIQEKLF